VFKLSKRRVLLDGNGNVSLVGIFRWIMRDSNDNAGERERERGSWNRGRILCKPSLQSSESKRSIGAIKYYDFEFLTLLDKSNFLLT
jgi:hypothetical protein